LDESVLSPRERIRALVAAQPGLHLRELPRRLGLSLRSVRYHLETMADDEVVTSHRSGRFARWFAVGVLSAEDRSLISALRVRGQRTILTHLLRSGPTRFAPLQRATGLSSATLARDLGRLSAERLVELGPDRLYRLCDPGATAMRLALYRGRFPDLLADAAVEIFDPQR
jgi:predicted transcriptional regulator